MSFLDPEMIYTYRQTNFALQSNGPYSMSKKAPSATILLIGSPWVKPDPPEGLLRIRIEALVGGCQALSNDTIYIFEVSKVLIGIAMCSDRL